MDLQTKLTILSILGGLVGVLSLVISQLWRSSVEVQGQFRKRMTPAGWVLLAISLVGFAGTIISEGIRAKIRADDFHSSQARSEELVTATQPLTALSLQLKFPTLIPR